MLYEKRLLVLGGKGTGCVRLERTAAGISAMLSANNISGADLLIIVRDDAGLLTFLPSTIARPYSFSLPESFDLSRITVIVADGEKLLLHGTLGSQRLWTGNLEDEIKRARKILGKRPAAKKSSVSDFFFDIVKPEDYDDNRIAEINYYKSNLAVDAKNEAAATAAAQNTDGVFSFPPSYPFSAPPGGEGRTQPPQRSDGQPAQENRREGGQSRQPGRAEAIIPAPETLPRSEPLSEPRSEIMSERPVKPLPEPRIEPLSERPAEPLPGPLPGLDETPPPPYKKDTPPRAKNIPPYNKSDYRAMSPDEFSREAGGENAEILSDAQAARHDPRGNFKYYKLEHEQPDYNTSERQRWHPIHINDGSLNDGDRDADFESGRDGRNCESAPQAASPEYSAAQPELNTESAPPQPRRQPERRAAPQPPPKVQPAAPLFDGTPDAEEALSIPPPSMKTPPILEAAAFYDTVKAQLDKLFAKNEHYGALERLLPDSKWVRVDYDNKGKFYLIGLVGEPVRYICYGVPGKYSPRPPAELAGYCQWLAIDEENPIGEGFWVMYQDAVSGKSVL